MKLLVSVAVACQLAILLPAAMGQSSAAVPTKLHLQTFRPRGNAVLLAANRIERDASSPSQRQRGIRCVLPAQTGT